jgi:hypothetical protein
MQTVAGVFRLVDQSQSPLDRSMFQVQGNGNDQRIEAFEDGYFFFTIKQNRHSSNEPSKVIVNQIGLRPSEFELALSPDRVPVSKDFVVQRYDDSAKQTYRALVADKAGKPIAGAKLALQAISERPTRFPGEQPSGVADAEGKVQLQAFPMRYNAMVSADGYKPEGQMIELKEGVAQEDQRFELYRTIDASVHVAWILVGGQPTPTTTAGEALMEVKNGQPVAVQFDPNGPVWVHPIQIKDQLVLQFNPNQYGPPAPGANFGVWTFDAKDGGEAAGENKTNVKEKFEALDLNKFDEWKKDLKPAKPERSSPGRSRGPVPSMPPMPMQTQVPADEGKIYVGKVPYRDPRNGQPVETTFKLYVELEKDK